MSRTVVIGLDGATFSVLDPLMQNGVMPFLDDFVTRGVRGELLSTIPHVSPVAWTSFMTGCSPGRHGIFDFIRAEERNGEMYFTLYNSRDIRCETIWSMISRQNMRVTLLNFMLTSPPLPISGYIVPGLVSWKHMKRGVYPPELYERLKRLPGLNYKEMAWDFELEKKVLQHVGPEEYEAWIRFHTRREHHWFQVARYLMQTDPCDLTVVVFDGIDKLQHICWRFLDPELAPTSPSPFERKIRDLCREYFSRLDGYLAEIISMAGPEARIFFASDHGFGPSKEVFRVNAWLHEQGYLTWRTPGALNEAARQSWERRLNSNFALLDWEKTKAYARTPSSNGIFITQAHTTDRSGRLADECETFRSSLISALYGVVDPKSGERIVERVWTREEAFPGSQMQHAPDLTLSLRDHGFVSIKNSAPAVQPLPEVCGTHRPEGIFIAGGVGIRKAVNIDTLSIIDMASTLLYSLGLEVPEDMEGRVPVEVFEPSWVKATPVRIGEPSKPPGAPLSKESAPKTDAEDEALVLERLKALGYLE
jgi:predicted AlkP superfamily phosphohydrolase/phosphomutase